jgi:ribosomal subunit interface protein
MGAMHEHGFIVRARPLAGPGTRPARQAAERDFPDAQQSSSIGNHRLPKLRRVHREPTGTEMRYQISGKQMDVGEALQTHVQTELGEVLGKYPGRPTDAYVVFSKSAHQFVCEAVVHLSTGLTSQAKGQANDVYAAFDSCAEKMDKQLRRYKRRLKDHHRDRAEPVEQLEGSAYILAGSEDQEEGEPETLQPMIIAEMGTRIPSITVGEAVMQLELAGAPVLVFRNEGIDRVNVVYRREDGNIGWIDPGGTK